MKTKTTKTIKVLLVLAFAMVAVLSCMSVAVFAATDPDNSVYLTLDKSTPDAIDTKEINQLYNATVAENKTNVTKVQVSWELETISASVTLNKIWDTEDLQWVDDTANANTATASAVTATFNIDNLSSVSVISEVSFAPAGSFNPAVAFQVSDIDRQTGNLPLDSAANGAEEHAGKVKVTLTPDDDDFASVTENATGATYGTYTVTINPANYWLFGRMCG